jgi:ubiquinone/menaquinone biosynthesis C-methylase UbiE
MARGPKPWFFDAWSRVYDLSLVQRVVYRPPHDAVLRALRDAPCRTVLDVGCGTGQLAARLRRELPRSHVVGCDFSAGMLAEARVRDRRTHWVQGDAGRLPFADAVFDAVVSTEAFHWFPDPGRALAEFRRVLRPAGRLLLALVNPRLAATGRIVELASRAIGQPFHWPTRDELRDRVQAAGFRVERQVPILRLPGAILLPPALTVATVRPPKSRAPRARTMVPS